MKNFSIDLTLKREHFLISQLDFQFKSEDQDILAYLNRSLQFSPENWLDLSVSNLPISLLSLLSSIQNLETNILIRKPPHFLSIATPLPEQLLRDLLIDSVSWQLDELFPLTPSFSSKPYFPKLKVDFFEKKLFLLNPENSFLLPTQTRLLIITPSQIRPLHPLFDNQPMIELFRTGLLDAPAAWIENLSNLPAKHPARKWLQFPKIRPVNDNFSLAVKLEKTSDRFILYTGVAESQNTKKSFLPLPLAKIRQAMLVNEAFILEDRNELLIIPLDSPLYNKVKHFVSEVYRNFFDFLGEIDENKILTKDKETLFHKFLPLFSADLLILSQGKLIQFHRADKGTLDLQLQNPEDLENNKIDWLKVDFKYKIEGEELNLAQIREILQNGYTISNQKWITLSSKSLKTLSDLFENLKIDSKEKGNFIHRYRLLTVPTKIAHSSDILTQLQVALNKKELFQKPLIPEELKTILREYQKFGVSWFQFLDRFGFGGILADEMGLGKTLQVLSFLALRKDRPPSLIVCPSSLIYNWSEEIERFFGDKLPYLVIDGKKEIRAKLLKKISNYRLAITSYNMVHLDKENYKDLELDYCIIDEAQHIKNKAAKRTRSIKGILSRNRIAITGTPIENNLGELWSVFDFLMPGFLGTHKEFQEEFEVPINGFDRKNAKQALKKLKDRVSPFILRRTKSKVIRELPPKSEQIIHLELTEKQKALYLETLEQVKKGTLMATKTKGIQNSYMDFLAALTRLRQVCLHTALIFPEEQASKDSSVKLNALIELIEEAMDSHHRVLVFSQFVQMLKLIRQEFHKQEIQYLYLDGKTKNRVALVNQFNQSDVPVFLISLRAGGVGLNLTGADAVILFDPWWNPAVENQAIDRAHRIGQHNQVNVYRLVTRGTIEDKIHLLQKQKQGISDSILSSEDHFIRNLTAEDIRKLFEES